VSIISKTKLAILQELSKQPLHGYAFAKKLHITIIIQQALLIL